MVAVPTGQLSIDSAGEISLPEYPCRLSPARPQPSQWGSLVHLHCPASDWSVTSQSRIDRGRSLARIEIYFLT